MNPHILHMFEGTFSPGAANMLIAVLGDREIKCLQGLWFIQAGVL